MLGNWVPSSRDRFTAADFCFLSDVLAPGEGGQALARLWDDPQAMREMLDLKEVLRAVLGSSRALEISASFYFYVLVRHAFVQAGLGDEALADYVAGVLAERVSPVPGDTAKAETLFRTAIKLKEPTSRAYLGLFRLYQAASMSRTARLLILRAHAIDPDDA